MNTIFLVEIATQDFFGDWDYKIVSAHPTREAAQRAAYQREDSWNIIEVPFETE
jgi:hypothetical protein